MALHRAPWNGDIAVVELLVKKGADIEARTNLNSTPLHQAAYRGNEKFTRLPLDKGADIHARDGAGRTALRLATMNDRQAVVELLK